MTFASVGQHQLSIRFLSPSDESSFRLLNERAFAENPLISVDPKHFVWSPSEDKALVWGIVRDFQLLAYFKVELFRSEAELERRLLGVCAADLKIAANYPVLYNSKAATHPDFQKEGLNTKLREVSHEIARRLEIRYVIGTTVAGSSRVKTMQKWGYEFFENPQKWNGSFKSDSVPLVGVYDFQKSATKDNQRNQNDIAAAKTFVENEWNRIQQWFKESSRTSP